MKPISQKNKQSLMETHPELAKEWHPTKNGDLTPQELTAGSHKKVWWKCDHGHEWEATIKNRSKGSGCPYCSSKKVFYGFNDLETSYPDVAKEWHPTKNGDLTPRQVTPFSNKKVWWLCSEGHKWESQIAARTSKSSGCPFCSSKKVFYGINDLATINPELAKEWHPTKNGDLTPQQFPVGSYQKVWWQCPQGHEWEARIYSRSKGSVCPYCSGRFAISGETDLESTHPEIAKEWHPTKNEELTPQDVLAFSNKKVWWQCEHGHEWSSSVANRTNGKNCPYCSGLFAIKGETDLATTHPKLAKEWHPTKNGDLTPCDVKPMSNKKVWWICKYGHEWLATIYSRSQGLSCPYCSNKKVLMGFNDLGTTHPELVKEWHPTKNGDLTPRDVVAGSSKIIWWKCTHNHEWNARVLDRRNGSLCPFCYVSKF